MATFSLFQPVTLNMAATTGYTITFSPSVSTVVLMARAECYVALVSDGGTPVAPSSSPAPSSGNQAKYIHLQAGDKVSVGLDPQYQLGMIQQADRIGGLNVYAIAAGFLEVLGH